MSTLPALFIDLDGVLLDVEERHFRVHSAVLQAFGAHPTDRQAYWQYKRNAEPLNVLLEVEGCTHISETAYRQLWLKRIEALEYLRLDTLVGQADNVLRQLVEVRSLVLVTLRRRQDCLHTQLDWLNLTPLFTEVLAGRPSGTSDSEIKGRMIKGSAYFGPSAILIGDTEVDIQAGKALGLATIAVQNGMRNESKLRAANPDWILESIDALPTLWEYNRL